VGGGIGLALIIGLVVFFVTRPDEAGLGGDGGPIAGPTETHIDVTGQFTLSDDLKQTEFITPPPGAAQRHTIAAWEGARTTLAFDFDAPTPGAYTTGQLPRLRRLDFTFNPSPGINIEWRSTGGECEVTIEHAETGGLSGTYECLSVVLPGSEPEQTVDIEGTFFAKAEE
jgi:hypothetical protein